MGPAKPVRQKFLRFLVFLILYPIILLILPLFILILLPTPILRLIIGRLTKLIGPPGLGKMLTSLATTHALNPNWSTIVLSLNLQGSPNLEKIRSEFITNVLEAKDKNGDIRYPELKQTVVSWCGFLFWKEIEDLKLPIRIDNFRENQSNNLKSPSGTAYLSRLADKIWRFGTEPLWEIIIIPGKDDFVISFCIHHAIGDAYSAIELLDKVSNPGLMDQMIKPKMSANSQPKTTILDFIRILLRIPYDVAVYLEATRKTVRIPDVINTTNPRLTNKVTFAQTSIPIHLPTMKKRAKACGVSFTTFLFNSMTTSIRKQVLKRDGKVRGNILLHFPMPLRNRPHKLRNASAMGYINLPIQEVDPTLRMRMIESQLFELRKSSFPYVILQLNGLLGLQSPMLLKHLINSALTGNSTISFTNLCFNTTPFALFGYTFIGLHGAALGTGGTKVVPFVFITSGDEAVLSVTGDSGNLELGVANNILSTFTKSVGDPNWTEDDEMETYAFIDSV